MRLLTRLFGARRALPPELATRLTTWRALPEIPERTPLAELRFVVVDVETTGLDARRDRLLAIGAAGLERLRMRPADTLEVLVRNIGGSDRENILVHGIGPQEQAAGEEAEVALLRFLEFAGRAPLLAYHAGFDEVVLGRALRATLGLRLPNPFIDLAYLAPRVVPQARIGLRGSLDDWLVYFGLRVAQRHRAVFDSIATGELALILFEAARRQGIEALGQLRAAAERPDRGPGGI